MKTRLVFAKYHDLKTSGGVEVQLHAFLISALDGGEWWASQVGHFTLAESAPATN